MIFDDTGYHRLQGILCYLWKVWKSIWLWKMWICACNSCFTVDTVCMCVRRGSKWFQQLDKLLWNGKWKTEPKHRLYLHYRTGGWQFDNDNDATFSIELTYYYHSHFVSSIMSLFKFHEMLAIFDTLLFFSCSSCCRLNVRRMNLLGSTMLRSSILYSALLYSTQLNSSLSLNLDASHK